ncbi:MAG: hypothetical protein Q8O67_29195 [Deltaproteobacteria bacterium]|nr:hypothetical protein [Deltaproteobacteria bacterium]
MATEQVWVEVEVQKGTLVSVYRGRLDANDLDRWCKGELTKGAIPLHDIYWSYDDGDGNEGWVVVGATPGPYSSASGYALLRVDLILVILPLRDGSEREAHRLRPRNSGADA